MSPEITLGAVAQNVTNQSKPIDGGADKSEFEGLVQKLMEDNEKVTESGDDKAGQQQVSEEKDDSAVVDMMTGSVVQAELLLGSMGVIQETPNVISLDKTITSAPEVEAVNVASHGASDVMSQVGTPASHISFAQASNVADAANAAVTTANSSTAAAVSAVNTPEEAVVSEVPDSQTQVAQATTPEMSVDQPQVAADAAVETPVKAEAQPAPATEVKPEQQVATNEVGVEAQAVAVQAQNEATSQVLQTADQAVEAGSAVPQNQSTEADNTGKVKSHQKEESKQVGNARATHPGQKLVSEDTQFTVEAVNPGSDAGETGLELGAAPRKITTPQVPAGSVESGAADTGYTQVAATVQNPEPSQPVQAHTPADASSHVANPVISAKVIDQVVTAAKVNTFQGGADMSIRLEPAHLGTIQLNVAVEQGVVSANIQTSTESARQMLQADMALLKQSLTDAGIRCDSINVSVGMGMDQQKGHSQGWQEAQNQQNQRAFYAATGSYGFGRQPMHIEPSMIPAAYQASSRLDYRA